MPLSRQNGQLEDLRDWAALSREIDKRVSGADESKTEFSLGSGDTEGTGIDFRDIDWKPKGGSPQKSGVWDLIGHLDLGANPYTPRRKIGN